jgi:hypothetical protein
MCNARLLSAGLLVAVAVAVLFAPGANMRAQSEADSLEALARTYEQRLAAIEKEREQVLGRFEKAAQKVDRLKEQEQSFLQQRRLERALRELQTLADAAEAVERQLQELKAARDSTLAALWAYYDAEVSRLAASIESELPRLSEKERLEHGRALVALRRKRAEVSGRLALLPSAPDSLPRWALTPEEDYRRLEDKATLLQDRAARLRQDAAAVEKRLQQLREEVALRQRLNELLSDVALFDQHDETIAPLAGGGKAAMEADSYSRFGEATTAAQTVVAPTGRLWTADPAQLSNAEAELFMRELQAHKVRLLALADTLAARAQALAQKAALLRGSPLPTAP